MDHRDILVEIVSYREAKSTAHVHSGFPTDVVSALPSTLSPIAPPPSAFPAILHYIIYPFQKSSAVFRSFCMVLTMERKHGMAEAS
jgi:hypothetical protein